MSNLSIKKRKAKSANVRMTVKEFNEDLLNLMIIQDEMERLNTIVQQKVIETNEMHDKIEELKELIEYLTTSPTKKPYRKKSSNKNDKYIKSRIRMQARCHYARRI